MQEQEEQQADTTRRWVGFAALARTVTERLIQGSTDDTPPPQRTQLETQLADMRHVSEDSAVRGQSMMLLKEK